MKLAKINSFKELTGTMRSRNISVNIILQGLSQLKSMYEKTYNDIIGNCDTTIFLGGKEEVTLEFIVKQIGKETIDMLTFKRSSESGDKHSRSDRQVLGRDLITMDELSRLPNDECIVLIKGEPPYRSKKYNLKKHPNYKKLKD